MQRKLNVIIKFGKYDIDIKTIESYDSQKVIIFSNHERFSNSFSAVEFIKLTINKINTEIGGTINSAIVLVENNSKLNAKLHLISKELNLINDIVNQKDFDNSIKLIKKDFSDNIYDSLIRVQSVEYIIHGLDKKSYSKFPLNKNGKRLTIQTVVTTISSNVLEYITKIMEDSHLNIDYIATLAQSIPYETLSSSIQNDGISIHIDNRETYVTLNWYNTSLKYKVLNRGYGDILKRIKSTFNCTYEEANNLFYAYGNTNKNDIKIDKAIFISQFGITNKFYKISDLTSLIKEELSIILTMAKDFINSCSANKMNICISGVCNTLKSFDQYAKLVLNSMNIRLYKPLNYICKENMNIEYIGVLKYIEQYNKNIGKIFTSIVHTNPNNLRILSQVKKDSIFKKLFDKIKLRGNYAQR